MIVDRGDFFPPRTMQAQALAVEEMYRVAINHAM
jgi:hypothetical protein